MLPPRSGQPCGRQFQYLCQAEQACCLVDSLACAAPAQPAAARLKFAPEQHQQLQGRGVGTLHLAAVQHHDGAFLQHTQQFRLQRGLGDAILCAENFAGEKPFLVALGDSILGLNAVSQAVGRMADVFDSKRASCVIAVEEVPSEETSHYGIVQPEAGSDDVFRVVNLVEKPAPDEAPSNLAIAGRYIFSPVIFDMIRRVKPDKRNEIQLTDAIQFMCDEGRRVLAVKLTPEEKRYDIGNFPSYFESFVEFALADPLYGADFRIALERLLAKMPARV